MLFIDDLYRMELLQLLLVSITITVSNFSYCGDDTSWRYIDYWDKPYIEICPTEKEYRKFTILHELWHFFWYKYLTEEERETYIDLYNQSYDNDFYRYYSKSIPEEDFADNFALYYLGNKDNTIRGWILEFKIWYIWDLIKKNIWKK